MGDPGSPPSAPRTRDGEVPADPVTVGAAAPTSSRATTLVARSSLEAFLWVFVTRLIAILTAGRTASAPAAGAEAAGAPDRSSVDPARARRVAASRGDATAAAPIPPASIPAPTGDDRARTVAVTAATAAVGAAAAFALGRRRGRR